MEDASDRGERKKSHEEPSGELQDYRNEIREKYPDSGEDDQGKARPDSGEASERIDGAQDTKLEGNASKEERRPEQSNQSSEVEEKSELNAEGRSGTANQEDTTSEYSEPNAEPESQSDLDQFRGNVREKYPRGEVSESDGPDEPDRSSQRAYEGAEGSNSRAGRSNYEEMSDTASERAGTDAAEATPQDSVQDRIVAEEGKPASDWKIASQPEESGIEAQDGKAEVSKGPGKEAKETDGLRENRAAEDPEASEAYDGGGKIDSLQVDPGNDIQVESSARGVGSDIREDAVVEQTAQSIQEGPRKDGVFTPQVRDQVAELVQIQNAVGEQAISSGIDVASQTDEDHNRNASVEAAVNHAGDDSGEPKLQEAASTEYGSSEKEVGELQHLEQSNREQKDSLQPRLTKNQPNADAVAETEGEKNFSTDQSQIQVASAAKALRERQADSRGSRESLLDAIPDSRSSTKGERLGSQSGEASEDSNSRSNSRETNAADTTERFDVQGTSAQEVGNHRPKALAKEIPEDRLESNDTSFVVNETKGGPSHYLRIPHEHIDKFGKDEILEARVVRMSAPEREFSLYASSSYADPHFNIHHLNPAPRESFHVLSIRKFDFPDFVQDFNEHKPKAFGNVTLSNSEEAVTMKVDNLTTVIQNPRLSARGQGPILEGSIIQGTNRGNIRIAKEFESFSLHFGDFSTNHPRIVHMKAKESYIEVGYVQSSHESDYRTRRVPADSIEPAKAKSENDVKNRFTEIDSSNMTKKEIRAWIDTEGNIYSSSGMASRSGPEIRVVQKHREPLDVFARSVEEEIGVSCRVRRDKRGLYVAVITSNEDVAKVIREVGPFRTPQKCDQVLQFAEKLKAPRRERRRAIERSKTILDL